MLFSEYSTNDLEINDLEMEWWSVFKDWFIGLGEKYNVNPLIFGSIYVGAIPFFFASVAWLIKNIRNKKPVFVPVLTASSFFVSAYLYLIIAGKNIPIWVYIFIIMIMVYGIISTIRKVKHKMKN